PISRPPPALPSFPPRRSSDLCFSTLLRCPLAPGGWGLDFPFGPRAQRRFEKSGLRRVNAIALCVLLRCAVPQHFLQFLDRAGVRSEEHTSELQSLTNLVCRLL